MFRCPFKKQCIKELEEVKHKLGLERSFGRSHENFIERLHSENKALLAENEQLKEASAIKTVRVVLEDEVIKALQDFVEGGKR